MNSRILRFVALKDPWLSTRIALDCEVAYLYIIQRYTIYCTLPGKQWEMLITNCSRYRGYADYVGFPCQAICNIMGV